MTVSHGTMLRVERTTPAESRNAMSSGIFVRNIQKPAVGGCVESYTKSIP